MSVSPSAHGIGIALALPLVAAAIAAVNSDGSGVAVGGGHYSEDWIQGDIHAVALDRISGITGWVTDIAKTDVIPLVSSSLLCLSNGAGQKPANWPMWRTATTTKRAWDVAAERQGRRSQPSDAEPTPNVGGPERHGSEGLGLARRAWQNELARAAILAGIDPFEGMRGCGGDMGMVFVTIPVRSFLSLATPCQQLPATVIGWMWRIAVK
jgi:hypothetical protein